VGESCGPWPECCINNPPLCDEDKHPYCQPWPECKQRHERVPWPGPDDPWPGGPGEYGDWEGFKKGVKNFFTGEETRQKEADFIAQEEAATRRLEEEMLATAGAEKVKPPGWAWALLVVTGFGIVYATMKTG
jgi:hypothetical protein